MRPQPRRGRQRHAADNAVADRSLRAWRVYHSSGSGSCAKTLGCSRSESALEPPVLTQDRD
jgi:hypothetical protein